MNRVLVRQGVQQRAILTPQPHRFVIAAGDNGVAIRAHIDREYAPFMAGEAIKLIATKHRLVQRLIHLFLKFLIGADQLLQPRFALTAATMASSCWLEANSP